MSLTQISTAGVKDDAVTAGKIPANAVGSSEIAAGSIVNSNISSSAAIAGTKISPDFGSQNVVSTGTSNALGTTTIKGGSNAAARLLLQNTTSVRTNFIGLSSDDDTIVISADDANQGSNSTIEFKVDGSERMRITSDGKVGIGDTTPSVTLETMGHNQVTFGTMPETIMSYGMTSAYNSGSAGGGIQFGGKYHSNNDFTIFGGVHGKKENTTDGHFGGALLFSTRAHGGNSSERMRIDSSGHVGIGVVPDNTFSFGKALDIGSSTGSFVYVRDTDQAAAVGGIGYSGTDLYISNKAAGNIRFLCNTDATERMRIDSNGNVGIGTSPDSGIKLHVQHNGEANMILEGNVNGQGGFLMLKNNSDNANTTMSIQNLDAGGQGTSEITFQNVNNANNEGFMMFKTRPSGGSMTERMRITSAGNLLIGRTTVGNTGNGHIIRGGDSAIFSRDAVGETMQICRNSNNGDFVQLRENGSSIGEISKSGGNVVYGGTSDYRLKENEAAISDGITRIKLLKPIRFNFKKYPNETVDGFFAHEVTPAVPEAVVGDKDDSNRMQSLDQSKIVPLLTAALQEAIAKIETLETKVAALEAG